jgi:hypothetical protein
MIPNATFVDALGTQRLRAAADMACASAVYGDVLADATFQSANPRSAPAVQAAAAYVKQTRSAYDNARADHQRALDAAAHESLRGAAFS